MEGIAIAFLVFVFIVLVLIILAAAVAIVAFVSLTVYALVKPFLSGIFATWWDWFERRTGC